MKTRLFCCLAVLVAAPAAFAQKLLVVSEKGGPQVVRAITMGTSMVEKDGKLVSTSGTEYALGKAAIYGRGFVKLTNVAVKENRIEDLAKGTETIFGNDLDATISSDTPLKHCFFVWEINTDLDHLPSAIEMRDLIPGEAQKIRISVALQAHLAEGESHSKLHVFSDGLEILNSTMDPAYIAEQTRKTEEFQLKRVPDRPVGISRAVPPAVPVFPADLKAQGVGGSAKVSCTIDDHGNVVDVKVVEATHPSFGESLAAAAKQWKFEPAVKDHQYVQATAVIPYTFKVAAAEAK
jgi:TonB family protein